MIGPRLRQGSCRLCLWESNSLCDILGELAEKRNLARKIQACVNIFVSKDDGLSSLICPNCIYKVELFYDFQTSCKRSDGIQKRYNEIQDIGDRDMEDVFPATAFHCGLSNSLTDAHLPVENIDIKEEPLDDDEVTVAGVSDEQFEEVEAVLGDTEDEGVADAVVADVVGAAAAAEQRKEKEAEKVVAENGSCLQLTPPRSPSLESEVTCSASEGEAPAEPGPPKQQVGGVDVAGGDVRSELPEAAGADERSELPEAEVGGRSCKHCSKWHPDPSTCLEHESGCPRRGQQQVPPLPKGKYPNQCRCCGKWFQKTGVCRIHEMLCAPAHGYAAPPLPQARCFLKRCRFCSLHFVSQTSRSSHEYHCFRRQHRIQSAKLPAPDAPPAGAPTDSGRQPDPPSVPVPVKATLHLPPPAKYITQCRFCRKYFPRVGQRRMHEIECGPRMGYPAPPPPSVNPRWASRQGLRCTLCDKEFKTFAARRSHEYYCRKNFLRASRTSRLRDFYDKPTVVLHGPTRHCLSANQCRYCHSRFPTPMLRVSHEYSCAKESGWLDVSAVIPAVQAGEQNAAATIKCRYCGKGHLKWRSLLTHEFHCRRKTLPRTKSETEDPVGARDDDDDSASLAESGTSEEKHQVPPNLFRHKSLRSTQEQKVRDYNCSDTTLVAEPSYTRTHKCCHCSRVFLRRPAWVMHERFCPKARLHKGDSSPVGQVVTLDAGEQQQQQEQQQMQEQQQFESTTYDSLATQAESTDRQEITSAVMELEKKKMDSHLCLPVTASIKEADIWECQYCDKLFKYHESPRTPEVPCNTIATYQYTTPHHHPPSFFTCPLCRKAFKFRRKLHNHWKVCKARTSVVAEAADPHGVAKLAWGGPDRFEGSAGAVAPDGSTHSPGEDREEWRGWPSGRPAEVLADENSRAAESPSHSCKLCHKDFCSRVLLELHTLNECVYQRIRNDHAYAQCQTAGVDESTLMRMARVELQRLLLCSCCGRIFSDRQALSDHELSERHGRPPSESDLSLKSVDDKLCDDRKASHLEKKIKLDLQADGMCCPLEGRGEKESVLRAEQHTGSDEEVPNDVNYLENSGSRRESNKSSILQEILLGGDCNQSQLKVGSEKQNKHLNSEDGKRKLETKNKAFVFQQSDSVEGEQGSIKNSVLQMHPSSSTNNYQEQLKDDSSKMPSSADSRSGQGNQMKGAHLQLQNKLPNLALALQEH